MHDFLEVNMFLVLVDLLYFLVVIHCIFAFLRKDERFFQEIIIIIIHTY